MQFTPLDKMETVVVETERTNITLADYAPGIHCTPHAFFKKTDDGNVAWVVTRVCDHAGGILQASQHDAGNCRRAFPVGQKGSGARGAYPFL